MAAVLSNQPYGLTADNTPNSSANTRASVNPTSTSSTVFGNASQITCVTGRL